ncbi:MAG: branched-chain amino acid aminotransferase [Saprospiraceae bacterium]|nr:branched-chain amino acid aminotransferase [Saprospiraceae bacterium]MBK8634399.1 branched-chain amino acid aminotransferase [Saprospiraceae bacterium]MBP7642208.1 branched-chain amino acid aminotransferase [Saprospiraceae bacterium]
MALDIRIEKIAKSRVDEIDFHNIPFGKVFTDHMLEADYVDGKWTNVVIRPFANLSIHPGNAALHYGQSIFEGMKANRSADGNPLLFRAHKHVDRINASARRMCMPEVPEELFMEGLKKLVYLDKNWIPDVAGCSLYIRPFLFATDEFLGVRASETYKFMILLLPVGAYYSAPVKLKAEEKYVRAVQGGVGEAKTSGNYAASLLPAQEAKAQGYDQVMWLDGKEFKYIQEVGTMNIFFVVGNKILTPETDGAILKGITRDSILHILKDKGYDVETRPITIEEIMQAGKTGELKEVFGAGTAAVIAYVSELKYKNDIINLDAKQFQIAPMLYDTIQGLKTQTLPDKFGWVEEVTADEPNFAV